MSFRLGHELHLLRLMYASKNLLIPPPSLESNKESGDDDNTA